jgi:hypothetical protein
VSKTKRTTWRCFHCNEVFRSRKSALAHFGSEDFCKKDPPACIDPLRYDEKQRLTELRDAQHYALEMEESARESEDKVEMLEMELDEFKALTKCQSVHDLRMLLDSQQGELITARALIDAVRDKAPEVYAEIIQ